MSTYTRTTTDPDGTVLRHVDAVGPVTATNRAGGGILLTLDPAATREEIAREAFQAGIQIGGKAGGKAGWNAGYEAGRQSIAAAAVELVRDAVREVAAGGPTAAAMLLPRTKTIERDPKSGAISSIVESVG